MAYGIVYKITNKLNGMPYVGKTTRSLEVRFKEHAKADSYIGKAIRKYGEENFSREVIEECETPEELNEREIFWIAYFNCKQPHGYKIANGGEGASGVNEGVPKTLEQCAKVSEAKRGESPFKNLLAELDKRQIFQRLVNKFFVFEV